MSRSPYRGSWPWRDSAHAHSGGWRRQMRDRARRASGGSLALGQRRRALSPSDRPPCKSGRLAVVLAYATSMTVWCWQAPESVRRSDGSRPVRLFLARRAHLPVSVLGVGRLKGHFELTAALPRELTTASFTNATGGSARSQMSGLPIGHASRRCDAAGAAHAAAPLFVVSRRRDAQSSPDP